MLPQDPEECSATPFLVVLLSSCCGYVHLCNSFIHSCTLDFWTTLAYPIVLTYTSHCFTSTAAKAPKGLGHPSLKCPQLPPSSPVCPSNAPGDGALSFIFYDCLVPFKKLRPDLRHKCFIQTKAHVRFCSFKKLLLK